MSTTLLAAVMAPAAHAAWTWVEFKLLIERSIAFSLDSLHVMTGVVLQLLFSALLRRPVSTLWPWVLVLVLTCANETADLWFEQWPHPGMQYGESARDLLLTLFLPTVLMLTARCAPGLYGRRT